MASSLCLTSANESAPVGLTFGAGFNSEWVRRELRPPRTPFLRTTSALRSGLRTGESRADAYSRTSDLRAGGNARTLPLLSAATQEEKRGIASPILRRCWLGDVVGREFGEGQAGFLPHNSADSFGILEG